MMGMVEYGEAKSMNNTFNTEIIRPKLILIYIRCFPYDFSPCPTLFLFFFFFQFFFALLDSGFIQAVELATTTLGFRAYKLLHIT